MEIVSAITFKVEVEALRNNTTKRGKQISIDLWSQLNCENVERQNPEIKSRNVIEPRSEEVNKVIIREINECSQPVQIINSSKTIFKPLESNLHAGLKDRVLSRSKFLNLETD